MLRNRFCVFLNKHSYMIMSMSIILFSYPFQAKQSIAAVQTDKTKRCRI